MTKFTERSKAIQLRLEGNSYSQIKKQIKVSKSSLSLWLKNIPLTEKQLKKIEGNKERAIERFRETMRKKKEKRLLEYYKNQKKKWISLSKRELFLSGLFLYWGEGNKASGHTISISNTDPKMLKFSYDWITKALNIPKKSIKVSLQLYGDMNINKITDFWSKFLGISKNQFNKPYIKKMTRDSIDQKGYGYGTCNLIVHNTVIKENLLMAIKGIADFYSEERKI